jgi:hypothetical protein
VVTLLAYEARRHHAADRRREERDAKRLAPARSRRRMMPRCRLGGGGRPRSYVHAYQRAGSGAAVNTSTAEPPATLPSTPQVIISEYNRHDCPGCLQGRRSRRGPRDVWFPQRAA